MSGGRVKKAVIPAAGFGTRMLPFTKAVPKELIPLVDKPVLQYVAEEAVAAGAEEILIIISSGKEAIRRHFMPAPELEHRLETSGKRALLEEMEKLDALADIRYVYQEELDGLGGAVARAADFAGGEPVLVLLGDTVMERPVSVQLAEVYRRYSSSVIALETVPPERVSSYGIAAGNEIEEGVFALTDLVEKPAPEQAPGNNAVAARYLLTPAIFPLLAEGVRGVNNEIQLTDAVRRLMDREPVYGCRIAGKRFDLGNPVGFIAANVEFALRRPELQDVLGRRIMDILKENHLVERLSCSAK